MTDTESLAEEAKCLDELFKDRYTDADEKYMMEVSKSPSNPPVVYPWSFKHKQTFNRHMMYRGGSRGSQRRDDRYQRQGDRYHGRHDRNQDMWRDGPPKWFGQGSSQQSYRDRERW